MKLRYVGTVVTTFITENVGTVNPGDEFTVSDGLASVFLTRADVEEIVEVDAEEMNSTQQDHHDDEPGQSVVSDDGDSEKMSEENDGVPNDH